MLLGDIYCLRWQSYGLPIFSFHQKGQEFGFVPNGVEYIKASIAVTGKGRAKGATTTKRFLAKIVSIVTFNGS